MPSPLNIRRALISVYDKTGVVAFARALHDEFGVEILSTGGTAKVLSEAGVPVTLIETITGVPELLGGRVKTLHPTIFAAILADRDDPAHMRQLAENGIEPIDVVVVNLYPFEQTVADPNCTFEQAIEMIDVGGVALLRAAGKNRRHVISIHDPAEYEPILALLRKGLAATPAAIAEAAFAGFGAFAVTSRYDAAIAEWLGRAAGSWPQPHVRWLMNWGPVRYGENPQQQAFLVGDPSGGSPMDLVHTSAPRADLESRGDLQEHLSYNNYLDADAALGLCMELTRAESTGQRPLPQSTGWKPVPQDTGQRPVPQDTGQRPVPQDRDQSPQVADQGPEVTRQRPAPQKTHQWNLWHRSPGGDLWHRSPTGAPLPGSPTRRTWHRSPGGDLWHRSPTGAPLPGSPTGAAPIPHAVTDERWTRRNLPHLQVPGATYFVTFRLRAGLLAPEERDIVLGACTHWHGVRMTLHCATVMPDHVHLLLTPDEKRPGEFIPLGEIMHSIKLFSSNRINKLRSTRGPIWQDEAFDRVIRNEREFVEKWNYIEANPLTAGLVQQLPYAWFWKSDFGFGERAVGSAAHRLETGATEHRLETGATEHRSETGATEQRSETGATEQRSETGATGDCGAAGHACVVDLAVCVFIKHTNPCGVGIAAAPETDDVSPGPRAHESPAFVAPRDRQVAPAPPDSAAIIAAQIEAYGKAYLSDPNAAMGGLLACNFPITGEFAAIVMETYERFGRPLKEAGHPAAPGGFFIEVWIAPEFTDEAVEIIRGTAAATDELPSPPRKKWGANVRLLAVGEMAAPPDPDRKVYRSIAGGMLAQTPDLLGLEDEPQWRVVTRRAPSEREMVDLRLAWLICKHTKSNAITIVRDGMLLGNGAGQMSRVMSCRVAVWLARVNGHLRDRPEAGPSPESDRSVTGATEHRSVTGAAAHRLETGATEHRSETGATEHRSVTGAAAHRLETGATEHRSETGATEHRSETGAAGHSRPVAASDAFFPFRDGIDVLIDAGVTAVIQPGGSKRDAEVIAACDERGVAMVFTGTRHFRH